MLNMSQQDEPSSSSNSASSSNSSSNSNSNSPSNVFHLRIKSFKDVEIQVLGSSSVASVKRKVRQALNGEKIVVDGESADNDDDDDDDEDDDDDDDQTYLRLICKGRLLAPDTSPLTDFSVQDGDVLHAVLAKNCHSTKSSTHSGNSKDIATTNTTIVNRNHNHNHNHNTPTIANMNPATRRRHPRRNLGIVVGPGGRVTRSSLSDVDLQGDDFLGGDNDEDDGNNSINDEEEGRVRRGLDRLRSNNTSSSSNSNSNSNNNADNGMSRSEITAIRTYFSRSIDRYVAQHPNANLDEPDLRTRRQLFEEDWMAVQGPTSEFRLNLNHNTILRFAGGPGGGLGGLGGLGLGGRGGGADGAPNNGNSAWRSSVGTDRDFMWGFMLGFFVGFVMLVWVWMPTVPHKQKLGILTGITFQLAISVLQQQDDDEEPDEFVEN